MAVRKKAASKVEESDDGSAELMSSFADMMTLLLGFFMILYSMSHMDEKKFYELGKSIASSFKQVDKNARNQVVESMVEGSRQLRAFQMMIAILNLGEESQAIDRIEKEYSDLVEANSTSRVLRDGLKKLPGAEKMFKDPQTTGVYAEITLASGVMFSPGSDEILPGADKKLRRIASSLVRVQSNANIEVIGHTDAIPPAPNAKFSDNWALSSARAAAIARVLIGYGVSGTRISVKGRAHYEPLFSENDSFGKPIPANMAKNRRVSVRIIKDNGVK